jgi:hypothetical protein
MHSRKRFKTAMWIALLACLTICSSCAWRWFGLDSPWRPDTVTKHQSRVYLVERTPEGTYEVVDASEGALEEGPDGAFEHRPPRGYLLPEEEFLRLYRLAARGAKRR